MNIPLDILNYGKINPTYDGPEIKILFEDEFIIALDKPNGIHCHPLRYQESNNCLSFLRSKGKANILEINNDHYDRGLAYRLDKSTSGVLLYIKNEELCQNVREKFDSITKEKIYIAVVAGDTAKFDMQNIQHKISPSEKKGSVQREDKENGKIAKLQLIHLEYNKKKDLSLIVIKLKTGLRHQIRIQLKLLGHSILGDEIYGGRDAKRVFLHAYRYQLILNKKEYLVTSGNFYLFEGFFNFDRGLQMLSNKLF